MRLLPLAILLLPTVALADGPDEVTVSLPDFLRLYEDAKNRPEKPEPAPRVYSLSSAHYDGEVQFTDGEPTSAVFKARMHVDVLLDKGWVQVPLLPTTVALESAKIGGKEAPITLDGGYYTLTTQQKGGFDIDLVFSANVVTVVGASAVAFEMVPSGATDLRLAVPSADKLAFTVANARRTSERIEGGKRVVEASLPAQGSLSVQWQREIPTAQKQAPRVYSQVYTLVSLGDGVLHASTTIDNTILFSGINEVKVRIPDGMTLLDVKGAGIRDWTLGEDHVLDVKLGYAAEGSYTLGLELEKVIGQAGGTVAAPIVQPVGVERSKGWLGVEARGNIEITGGSGPGVTAIDVRTLPAAILGLTGQPILLGFKYLGDAPNVPLNVVAHQDVDVLVTVIDQARATTMFTADGRRLTSVAYDVRNNRTQFLRLGMPEGAELWSASVGGRAVQPAKGGDGRMLIPLVRSQNQGGALAAFTVEVVYVEKGTPPSKAGKGEFHGQLPRPDVPSTYVGWTVYAPTEAKVKKHSFEGTVRKVPYLHLPQGAQAVTAIDTATPQMQGTFDNQQKSGGMGEGAAPVPVRIPLEGNAYTFEKLISLDEDVLTVDFAYRGLKP